MSPLGNRGGPLELASWLAKAPGLRAGEVVGLILNNSYSSDEDATKRAPPPQKSRPITTLKERHASARPGPHLDGEEAPRADRKRKRTEREKHTAVCVALHAMKPAASRFFFMMICLHESNTVLTFSVSVAHVRCV